MVISCRIPVCWWKLASENIDLLLTYAMSSYSANSLSASMLKGFHFTGEPLYRGDIITAYSEIRVWLFLVHRSLGSERDIGFCQNNNWVLWDCGVLPYTENEQTSFFLFVLLNAIIVIYYVLGHQFSQSC